MIRGKTLSLPVRTFKSSTCIPLRYYHHSSHQLNTTNNNINNNQFIENNNNSNGFFSCYSSAKFTLPTHHTLKAKWIQVPKALSESNAVLKTEIKVPDPIPIDLVKQVHDHDFVDKFLDGTISPKDMKRIGFGEWNEAVRNRVIHTIGATLCATKDALNLNESRRSSNLAGGGHHSFYDRGSGYCIWNDIVIAGQYLINSGAIGEGRKYLVIDLDVHQGDGTSNLCRLLHSGKSFTFSMHCKHNFPIHKEKSDWDVELEDNMKDETYLRILSDCLDTLEQEHRGKIDFIFFQSGVDVLQGDRLGRLSLSLEGVLKRDQMVAEFAERMALHDPLFHTDTNRAITIPLVSMMGGGYITEKENTIDRVCSAHSNTVRTLRNYWTLKENSTRLELNDSNPKELPGRLKGWTREMDEQTQIY
ncbi:histone deacetylase [Naegleria gruberi]|uniref:Histone deacetylase n=1 Tax=Naegleria gruberi TaxID=5762 RepID=D2VTS7_NAEGR|nr:histone deacetylase [Naegleria gruberi]EFC39778.1 histone deacetylase [Naegleria gruberi]|eukprot:XP_002672522.1 histone deacetylase [Naegleria gruberi strain NEG-M]